MMMRTTRLTAEITAISVFTALFFAIPLTFAGAAAPTPAPGFVKGVSTTDLKTAYQEAAAGGKKVRILIVPGHEPTYGGTQYKGYYERELVVPLAEAIAVELRADPNLEVLVSRGLTGWNSDFTRLFAHNLSPVKKFVDTHKKAMKKLLKKGTIKENEDQASHNAAPTDVALRLYGITKWSNEHGVDLMVHVHLNDSGAHGERVGDYAGLTIYVPDHQYGNADVSAGVARAVFKNLNQYNAPSTLPIENKGVVEDQDLIALGAYNTSEVPSMLIEYSYIYEPKNTSEETRALVYADHALQTATGIQEFFGVTYTRPYPTRALPYTFTAMSAATSTAQASKGIYALQVALQDQGVYPAKPSTLVNCPIDGVMRACVTESLVTFQTKRGIKASGMLDVATRNALNALYSAHSVVETVPTHIPASASPIVCTPFPVPLELNSTDAKTKGAVTRLQKLLASDTSVYPAGKVTGFFGPATEAAVKAFQVKKGIAAAGSAGYGVVGPATNKALATLCASL